MIRDDDALVHWRQWELHKGGKIQLVLRAVKSFSRSGW